MPLQQIFLPSLKGCKLKPTTHPQHHSLGACFHSVLLGSPSLPVLQGSGKSNAPDYILRFASFRLLLCFQQEEHLPILEDPGQQSKAQERLCAKDQHPAQNGLLTILGPFCDGPMSFPPASSTSQSQGSFAKHMPLRGLTTPVQYKRPQTLSHDPQPPIAVLHLRKALRFLRQQSPRRRRRRWPLERVRPSTEGLSLLLGSPMQQHLDIAWARPCCRPETPPRYGHLHLAALQHGSPVARASTLSNHRRSSEDASTEEES
mmetsp:Transcript_16792/g.36106  ORF Transcript_16792/g.36106 Transcript_16792/m.36106 type:complete len:260 (-) Transcript_16792:165-944(-)